MLKPPFVTLRAKRGSGVVPAPSYLSWIPLPRIA